MGYCRWKQITIYFNVCSADITYFQLTEINKRLTGIDFPVYPPLYQDLIHTYFSCISFVILYLCMTTFF